MLKVVPRQPFVDQPHVTVSPPLHDYKSEFDIEAHSIEYDMVARLAGPVVIAYPLKGCPMGFVGGFSITRREQVPTMAQRLSAERRFAV